MDTIYLAKKKDGTVVYHMDEKAMYDMDGLKPEKKVSLAEFEAAGGLARVIGGKIVLGKTTEEKAEEVKQAKIDDYKAELVKIDQRAGAGRRIRSLVLAAAAVGGITTGEDYETLKAFENQADEWREKIQAEA